MPFIAALAGNLMENTAINEIQKIVRVSEALRRFWSNSGGWAPERAANLLAEARLDRQVSFANTLCEYFEQIQDESLDAKIILGYATLRGMCESAIKLFISVYVEDYLRNADVILNRGIAVLPKDINFDRLILFYLRKGDSSFEEYLRRVQHRGNAIHHFSDRNVGTLEELRQDIRVYESIIIAVSDQLPYPDGAFDPSNA